MSPFSPAVQGKRESARHITAPLANYWTEAEFGEFRIWFGVVIWPVAGLISTAFHVFPANPAVGLTVASVVPPVTTLPPARVLITAPPRMTRSSASAAVVRFVFVLAVDELPKLKTEARYKPP